MSLLILFPTPTGGGDIPSAVTYTNKVKFGYSTTASQTPATTGRNAGEIVFNLADQKMYVFKP